MQPFRLESSFCGHPAKGMGHYGLQVFKDAMVRLPFDEGQFLLVLLCLFFATRFVTGCVFLGVTQCLASRLTVKQELQWPELFLTTRGECYHLSRECNSIRHSTPLTRRVCSICARAPSRLQVAVKKDV